MFVCHLVYNLSLWSLRQSWHLFTEGGHLLLTIVVEDTDHVLDLDHTHLVSFYLVTIFIIVWLEVIKLW